MARKQNPVICVYKLVAILVLGIAITTSSGPLSAEKINPLEKQLRGTGFRQLNGEEIISFYTNRTVLMRSGDGFKIHLFHHENGYRYLKYKGDHKKPWEVKENQMCAESISGGTWCHNIYEKDGLIWWCGGKEKQCKWWSEESWDGDVKDLK